MCSLHSCISNTFVELARGHISGFLWVFTLNALPDTLSWTVPRTYTPDVSTALLSVAIPGTRLFHNQSLEKTPDHFHLNPPGKRTTCDNLTEGLDSLNPVHLPIPPLVTNLLNAVLLAEVWKTEVEQVVNATARLLLGKRSSRIPKVSYRNPWAPSWTAHPMAGTAASDPHDFLLDGTTSLLQERQVVLEIITLTCLASSLNCTVSHTEQGSCVTCKF